METLAIAVLFGGTFGMLTYALVRRDSVPPPADAAALRAEVDRYRAAIRAGTLCRYCDRPSPDQSRYCMHCGRLFDDRVA